MLTPRIFHHLRTMPPGAGGEIQLTDGIAGLMQEERVLAYASRAGATTAAASLAISRPRWITGSSTPKSAPASPGFSRSAAREASGATRVATGLRRLPMTLNELRYIVAVAQERSFGRAAAKCFVSQPALSVAIQKLEEELGAPLFERGKVALFSILHIVSHKIFTTSSKCPTILIMIKEDKSDNNPSALSPAGKLP